jgi:hypothetical protein
MNNLLFTIQFEEDTKLATGYIPGPTTPIVIGPSDNSGGPNRNMVGLGGQKPSPQVSVIHITHIDKAKMIKYNQTLLYIWRKPDLSWFDRIGIWFDPPFHIPKIKSILFLTY